MPWGVTNGLREIDGVPVSRTAEEDAWLAELETEAEQSEAQWADEHEVPDEVHERLAAIDAEIGALTERPLTFDAQEMARAGVFVSIEVDGTLCIERGYVRPEDEPVVEADTVGDGEENADMSTAAGDDKAGYEYVRTVDL